MDRNALRIVRLLALLALSPSWLVGQAETAAISGIITDSSNAVVPAAVVTVVSVTTGLTRSTITASAGDYALTNLKPDTYNLTIEHVGFRRYSRNIEVSVAARVDVSAQLVVATVSTTMKVTTSDETVALNTENQTLSTVLTSNQITDLPTLTRNPYDLVTTSGNVAEDTQSNRGAG
jgi:hypothetical protein